MFIYSLFSILAEEVFNFSQTDLIPEDVMLLDASSTIFMWMGKLSHAQDRKLSFEMALEYLRTGNFYLNVDIENFA